MGMPELALDDHHRDPLMRHLHGVGMPQLVGRQPAAHPCPVAVYGENLMATQTRPAG
jgi:hypothetical protein